MIRKRTPEASRPVEMEVQAPVTEDVPANLATHRAHGVTDHETVNADGGDAPSARMRGDHQADGDPAGEPEPCADLPLAMRVEALLMSTERPLGEARLAELLGIAGKGAVKAVTLAIAELNAQYDRTGRSFRAERLAGGWQLLTLASLGALLHRLHAQKQHARLSQPALETLSIIAYRQPIMRAEVEAIRGVASGEVLRGLMERRLVKIVGRAEELGRPMLYGTTSEFLKVFGLSGMDDLPPMPAQGRPAAAAKNAEPAPGGDTTPPP